jgi:hypothetical protein
MGKHFPDSEMVLIEAGSASLERNAYVKGLAYLEKARQISPLNSEIAAKIRQGLELKAVAHYTKGHYGKKSPTQWQKARETFELLLEEAASQQQSEIDLRSVYLLQWSVLEGLAVDKKESRKDQIRAQVSDMESHVAEYITNVYCAEYGEEFGEWVENRNVLAKMRGLKTPQQALQMLRFLLQIHTPTKSKDLGIRWLGQYFDRSLSKLKSSDREIAIALYRLLDGSIYYWQSYLENLLTRWLKLDKDDPLFLVWKWKLFDKTPTQKQIAKVRETAERSGDLEALKVLGEYLKYLDEEEESINDFIDYSPYEDESDDGFDMMGKIESMMKDMESAERIRFMINQGASKADAKSISDGIDLIAGISNFDDDIPIGAKPKKAKISKPAPKKKKVAKQQEKQAITEIADQQEFLF